MKYRIRSNVKSRLIITIHCFTHINSQVAEVIARYSTSALEPATVFCFLLFQETTFSPIDMQKPVVNRLSMGDPAQSASQ
ncbi:hypothetical protein CR513_28118, partial [Mucuna pruriens]